MKDNLLRNFSFQHNKRNVINDFIYNEFKNNKNIKSLVKNKSNIIDKLIKKAWKNNNLNGENICLVAVGGYGRAELFPFSDIDILILVKDYEDTNTLKNIEKFIADIWHFKTLVGHAVRTIQECSRAMNSDITIYTGLLESRCVCGSRKMYKELSRIIYKDSSWSNENFLKAKKVEQEQRYWKYSNTGYLLEPDIKEGPGGFRDFQTLMWITKKYFKTNSLNDLYKLKIISKEERLLLLRSYRFLSKARFFLHFINDKPEERLFFSNQKKLAEFFGYSCETNKGVERFMQEFYKQITLIRQLNEILIKHIEDIDNKNYLKSDFSKIKEEFIIKNNNIYVKNKEFFINDPTKIFEIFLLKDKKGDNYEISADTIRHIRESLYLIDNNFRNKKKNREIFISIFYQKTGVTRCLRKMNDYGVLAAYLKPFSKVVGMMQFDLFHIYTVDEHTLSVLSNVRYMSSDHCMDKRPFVFEIFKKVPSPEILYLGALFHDIGKGKNKDHSKVGSTESLKFCEKHGMSKYQAQMVSWLVENHLIMSLTIQKKDISDLDVIKEFASIVKTQERLDYLYLLTIADIRGTNPELYTDWKDSLLKELYLACKAYFRRNIFEVKKPDRYMRNLKSSVQKFLSKKVNKKDFDNIWSFLNTDYLRRHNDDEVAWHIELINRSSPKNAVSIRESEFKGCTELSIYQNKRKNIFTYIANIIDNLNINIVDARVITLKDNQAIDTYLLLDKNGSFIKDKHTLKFLEEKIEDLINKKEYQMKKITKRPTENISSFKKFVNISISKKMTDLLIEISTLDHPGLLSKICESFDSCDLMVKDAKISTLGEEANDIFVVFPFEKNKDFSSKNIDELKSKIKLKISELY